MRANDALFVLASDFSSSAVSLLKGRDEYAAQLRSNRRRVYAWVADLAADSESAQWTWLETLAKEVGGLHFVTLIYVLSAVEPQNMQKAVVRLAELLRPGGLFFFRDYAEGDMKQTRFDEKGTKNKLNKETYKRGEGTYAHYFSSDELRHLFESDGLLETLDLVNVNREIVNRARR